MSRALRVQRHQYNQILKHGANGFVISVNADKYNNEGIPNQKIETKCKYISKILDGSEKLPVSIGQADIRIAVPYDIAIKKGDEFKTFDGSVWSVEIPAEMGVVQDEVMIKIAYLTRI
jgi:hypothetical protein